VFRVATTAREAVSITLTLPRISLPTKGDAK
jgi:hypothetical protein